MATGFVSNAFGASNDPRPSLLLVSGVLRVRIHGGYVPRFVFHRAAIKHTIVSRNDTITVYLFRATTLSRRLNDYFTDSFFFRCTIFIIVGIYIISRSGTSKF